MLNELDGVPVDPVQQLGQSLLAFMQRQVAQVGTIVLQQVEGIQYRLWTPASAPQCPEVRHPVVAGNHRLAVDQERIGLC